MQSCIQARFATGTQSVWEHGTSVLESYQELVEAAQAGAYPAGWRMPKFWTPELARALAASQLPGATMTNYLQYHDCGKPYCLETDEQGRSHFPDHAEVSAKTWAALGGTEAETWLMRHDMLLHTGSAEDCAKLSGHPLAAGLLFAALAEVHSNAQMFGGVTSDSFKAKFKQIERRGRFCC